MKNWLPNIVWLLPEIDEFKPVTKRSQPYDPVELKNEVAKVASGTIKYVDGACAKLT